MDDFEDPVVCEEIFGLVVVVVVFCGEVEVVALVNDTIYGFFGSIWMCDGVKVLCVACVVEIGVLLINSNTLVRVLMLFGGFKQLGYGCELGLYVLDVYIEMKIVYYVMGG